MIRNFSEAKEQAAQNGTEYLYGAVQTDLAAVPVADRLIYVPAGVLQYNMVMDTNGCASRGPLNILETKLDYFYDHGMHPNLQQWCDEQGYRVNGKFVLCDAFIEILSGTTPEGNSLKAPVDTIYRLGVIPGSLLPLGDTMTWAEYMNPSRITKAHMDLGKEFLRRFGIAYEQVSTAQFVEALQDDLLDVAGHAWDAPVNGVYLRDETAPFNHVFACVNQEVDVLDNYVPFVKRIAKDYKLFDWGYSLSIVRQTPYPDETLSLFETLQTYGLLAFFAQALQNLITGTQKKTLPTAIPSTLPTPITPNPMSPLAEQIVTAATAALNTDPTPMDTVPDEVACVASLVAVLPATCGLDRTLTYTPNLFAALKNNPHFKPTLDPVPGTIIVSPTKGSVIGHCGVYIGPDTIASNNSFGGVKGLFTANYTRQSWRDYFIKGKGLKGYFFTPVDKA